MTLEVNKKLKGLYTIWSEIKHFYPYQEKLKDINWENLVDDYVNPVMAANNVRDYYFELMKFVSHVNDNHTTIIPPWKFIVPNYLKPAIEVKIHDDLFTIIRFGENDDLKRNDIQVGDTITMVDDIPVKKHFENVNKLYARGSKQADEAINSFYLLMGPIEREVKLELQRDGKKRTVSLKRDCTSNGQFFLDAIIDVNPSYNLSVSDKVLTVVIKEFSSDALVNEFIQVLRDNDISEIHFDLRNNMGGNDLIAYGLIEQIISEPLQGVKYKYKVSSKALKRWGYPDEWKIMDRTIEPNNTTNYSGKVRVSYNGATSSTGEDFVITLSNRPNTVFDGILTAGSSGNPYSVELPYGGILKVSTFIGLDSKGNEYVGIGFNPNSRNEGK